jgi:predicted ATP-dependent endonuclease of OLD family
MTRFFSELTFFPSIDELISPKLSGSIVVLTGGNNSGKSAYLKTTINDETKLYVGVNRFYSFHHLSLYTRNDNEINSWYNQMQSSARHQEFQNFENSFFNCSTAISRLSNERRKVLFDVFRELFGIPIEVKPEDPENEFSNKFIEVDGDSLSVTSSGTRLFLGILAALMDDRFTSVAIDEPELGLSPVLQKRLADIIIRGARKSELFAHSPNIVLSTHSHLFLDKNVPGNNYVVSREGSRIFAKRCESFHDLNEIQFRLLGNDLGELFLPDVVVFVEGETDKMYLEKILGMQFPDAKITIQQCGGDIAKRLAYWSETLGDMQLSPYRMRTFIIYDSVKQSGIDRAAKSAGLARERMIEWKGNGIEFVYPSTILSEIFRTSISNSSALEIDHDTVSSNGISYKKMELCKMICERSMDSTQIEPEVVEKLIEPLKKILG